MIIVLESKTKQDKTNKQKTEVYNIQPELKDDTTKKLELLHFSHGWLRHIE